MLRIRPLKRDQIAQMLPVLRQVDPAAVSTLVRRLVGRGEAEGLAGIMAVAAPDGMFRGGFVFEIESGRDRARTLAVHHLAIPQLGQTRVADLIESAVETLAQTRNCGEVRIELPADAEWEAGYFAGRGHTVVRVSPPVTAH